MVFFLTFGSVEEAGVYVLSLFSDLYNHLCSNHCLHFLRASLYISIAKSGMLLTKLIVKEWKGGTVHMLAKSFEFGSF